MMIKAKPNLTNFSFAFLVRLDTIERLENLLAVSRFLMKNLESKILVLECAPFKNGILENLFDQSDNKIVSESDNTSSTPSR